MLQSPTKHDPRLTHRAGLLTPSDSSGNGNTAKGKGNGDRKFVSDIYYTTGLSIYAPVFEAARLALKAEKAPLTPEKMRKGLESLKMARGWGHMGTPRAPHTLAYGS